MIEVFYILSCSAMSLFVGFLVGSKSGAQLTVRFLKQFLCDICISKIEQEYVRKQAEER